MEMLQVYLSKIKSYPSKKDSAQVTISLTKINKGFKKQLKNCRETRISKRKIDKRPYKLKRNSNNRFLIMSQIFSSRKPSTSNFKENMLLWLKI